MKEKEKQIIALLPGDLHNDKGFARLVRRILLSIETYNSMGWLDGMPDKITFKGYNGPLFIHSGSIKLQVY